MQPIFQPLAGSTPGPHAIELVARLHVVIRHKVSQEAKAEFVIEEAHLYRVVLGRRAANALLLRCYTTI
jgi:hypothetical protein